MKKTILFITLVALATFNCKAQLTTLHSFGSGTDGNGPQANLISIGGYLYGMTPRGGPNDDGIIFKIKSDGTGYDTLMSFNGANGAYPSASLFYDGTFLYGMTENGNPNTNSGGTIFKIKPDGSAFDTLIFSSIKFGSDPKGTLISDGTFLYGMTYQGGLYGEGNVFKIKPDGSALDTLISFNGTNGAYPKGSLISDGTYLYGMTNGIGSSNFGNIFKIKPEGTGFDTIFNFNGNTTGINPQGSLYFDGTFLYGMTPGGGVYHKGTIFKIKPDGTGYSDLYDFVDGSNDGGPYGSLISDGTFL